MTLPVITMTATALVSDLRMARPMPKINARRAMFGWLTDANQRRLSEPTALAAVSSPKANQHRSAAVPDGSGLRTI